MSQLISEKIPRIFPDFPIYGGNKSVLNYMLILICKTEKLKLHFTRYMSSFNPKMDYSK
jgi:hypothetical protein